MTPADLETVSLIALNVALVAMGYLLHLDTRELARIVGKVAVGNNIETFRHLTR